MLVMVFFFKQKTAYEMRISDWSADVCSSDLTHRITPDALALIADAVDLPSGFRILNPAAMVCHCAAHLLADGDLQGGLRNLWDFHCLTLDFLKGDPDFYLDAIEEAARHGLVDVVKRAFRLSHRLYGRSEE